MSDTYRIVSAVIKGIRPNSIFVAVPSRRGDVSIPRSLVHGGDDLKLDRARVGDEFSFRLRAWKAEEVGLV